MADSDDLFDFAEVEQAAAAAGGTTAPHVDSLLQAFDDHDRSHQRAPLPDLLADPDLTPPPDLLSETELPPVSAAALPPVYESEPPPEHPQGSAPGPVLPQRAFLITLCALAAIVLLNAGLFWLSLRDASSAQERIAALSQSVLELAQRPQPSAPTAIPTPPPQPEAVVEQLAQRSSLPDYDADPRRERDFGRIEALVRQGRHGEARRELYQLLARCDSLVGNAREAVELRATYLLAQTLRDEAQATGLAEAGN
jgi:hypothetical protein